MGSQPAPDKTISLTEAARRLGVSHQHLSQLAIKGTFPATNVYGLWRIREEDVCAVERGDRRVGDA